MNKPSLNFCGVIFSGSFTMFCLRAVADTELPVEPVQIGRQTQFFVDDFIVDNRWPLLKREEVLVRTIHRAVKHPANPVLSGRGGYVNVIATRKRGSTGYSTKISGITAWSLSSTPTPWPRPSRPTASTGKYPTWASTTGKIQKKTTSAGRLQRIRRGTRPEWPTRNTCLRSRKNTTGDTCTSYIT